MTALTKEQKLELELKKQRQQESEIQQAREARIKDNDGELAVNCSKLHEEGYRTYWQPNTNNGRDLDKLIKFGYSYVTSDEIDNGPAETACRSRNDAGLVTSVRGGVTNYLLKLPKHLEELRKEIEAKKIKNQLEDLGRKEGFQVSMEVGQKESIGSVFKDLI